MIKKIITILLVLIICGCSDRISLENELRVLGYGEEDISVITNFNKEDVKPLYESKNETLLKIIKDERFVVDNVSEYSKHYKEVDADMLFNLVNNGYTKKNNWNTIKSIVNNQYFIYDNLDLYIEHYSTIKDINKLIAYVNVGVYKKPYSDIELADTSDEMTVIANKWHYLGDYEPTNLVTIDRKYGLARYEQQLKQETYDAFIKMYEAAKKDKVNIYITSAYRSYPYQVQIYSGYLKSDSLEKVDTYSSRPGHSDHQTGLACDILSYGYNFDTFEKSQAFKWLSENAEKYGFILRFPKDKEDITGYMYESWHYRYVGEEIAKYIKDNKLTYEEYYAYFIENVNSVQE